MSHKTSPTRKVVFEVGARLEAMDFTQNWYSAKICRIDEKDKKALIHFEGWNHRYDEWIDFDSSRLRPHHRLHLFQEAKEEKKQDWTVGDRVLAKWLDCKYYPAKVTKCNPEGTCEVLFYDGVKKTVQRSNMKPDNKKTVLMPAIKELDAGERQKRRVQMASARAARARKRSKEEAQEMAANKKEKGKKPRSQSHSTEDSAATSKASTSSPAEVPLQEDVFHKLEQKNIKSKDNVTDIQEQKPNTETSPKQEKQPRPQELKPPEELRPTEEWKTPQELKPTQKVKPPQELKPVQDLKPTENVKPTQEQKSAKELKESQALKPVQKLKPTQVKQPQELKTPKELKPPQELKLTEELKPRQELKPTQDLKPSQELKPLIFVKYKTEEECLSPPMEATQLTGIKEKVVSSVDRITTHETERYKQHNTQTVSCHSITIGDSSEQMIDLSSVPVTTRVDQSSVDMMETDEVLDVIDVSHCSPATDKTQNITPCHTDPAGLGSSQTSDKEQTENAALSTKDEINISDVTEISHVKTANSNTSPGMSKVLAAERNSSQEHPVTTAVIKKLAHKLTSEVRHKSPGLKLKTSRARGGKTASKRRGPRGGRSTLNPRGYGYSMAFMPQQTSETSTETTETSSTENNSTNTSTGATTTTVAASGTKPTPGRSQTYQAKKLRLDQITGKLSAQRQCEAKASVNSPSAFQATGHSPPPPHLPPSPVSLPPAQTPSPSGVTSPYPMESYPPPLLYAPTLAPPCCTNPHHQHQPYPSPGPPPRGPIPHGLHLPARHVHPHQDFHPQSSGYMVYQPPQGPPYPRPCMGSCCQHLYHSLPHDSSPPPPPPHESALVRLMQCEQRMLHPSSSMPCFREMSPSGPWTAGVRHTGPSSHYMPGPHTHEELWRSTTEGLPSQTSPSPSISPVTQSESLLSRQQSKRSRKSERPLPTNTKSLPTTPSSTPTGSGPAQTSITGDSKDTESDKSVPAKEHDHPGALKEKGKALPDGSSNERGHAAEAALAPAAHKALPVSQGLSTSLPVGAVPPSVPSSGVFVPSAAAAFTGALHAYRPRKGKEGLGFAPKELVIEIDHNKYKCKVQGCDKSFRKESGLEYHMKYYHSEKNNKRKRTSASARLDSGSDISPESTGPRKTKRRFHRYSAPGHLSTDPSPLMSPMSGPEGELGTSYAEEPGAKLEVEQEIEPGTESEGLELGPVESVEIEEEDERETDVIRCICNEMEEGGFMIQCEQCLTWQHSDCLGLNEETVPFNYLCYVCSNPKGLRLNAKYRNDHNWFRRGTLASFPFLPHEESEYDVELTCATHDLVSDVYNVNTVLSSLRVKLELLRDPSHPQIELWKHPDPPATEEAVDSVRTIKSKDPEELSAAVGDQSVVNGHLQAKLLLKVKSEPSVNGDQTTVSNTSESMDTSQDMEVNVSSEKPAELEKPLQGPEGTEVSAGSPADDLGVVKEDEMPLSPLPDLVPADRVEQGKQLDPIKKDDVQSSGERNDEAINQGDAEVKEGKLSSVEIDSSAGTRETDAVDSKPEEHNVDVGVEKKTCAQPDVVASSDPGKVSSEVSVSAQHVVKGETVEKMSAKEPLSAVENLLDDITSLQDEMDTRMTQIDKQLSVLEDAYVTPFPLGLKLDLRKLVKDLSYVRQMLRYK